MPVLSVVSELGVAARNRRVVGHDVAVVVASDHHGSTGLEGVVATHALDIDRLTGHDGSRRDVGVAQHPTRALRIRLADDRLPGGGAGSRVAASDEVRLGAPIVICSASSVRPSLTIVGPVELQTSHSLPVDVYALRAIGIEQRPAAVLRRAPRRESVRRSGYPKRPRRWDHDRYESGRRLRSRACPSGFRS